MQGAITLRSYLPVEVSLTDLGLELEDQCKRVSGGDLKRAEHLLATQAQTLDAIFHKLARRAAHTESLNQFDTDLRLALKAQSQCRATLESLAVIKNPPQVAFVRQANIAHGPQQVNNGVAAEAPRAGISENQPNKILEQQHGERLDFGAAGAASGIDSTLEAVGTGHRPQDKRG